MRRIKAILCALLIALLGVGALCGAAEEVPDGASGLSAAPAPKDGALTVGTDVAPEDITEFYYTYSSSAFPPEYQRYRFYRAEDAVMFDHETREGVRWPLTEADATVSGTLALDDADRARLDALLSGGTVRRRAESVESGDAGPWLFLYWNGDEGDIQEYSFASLETLGEFEDFCAALRERAQ